MRRERGQRAFAPILAGGFRAGVAQLSSSLCCSCRGCVCLALSHILRHGGLQLQRHLGPSRIPAPDAIAEGGAAASSLRVFATPGAELVSSAQLPRWKEKNLKAYTRAYVSKSLDKDLSESILAASRESCRVVRGDMHLARVPGRVCRSSCRRPCRLCGASRKADSAGAYK